MRRLARARAAAVLLALCACGRPPAPVPEADPCAGLPAGGAWDLNCSFSLSANAPPEPGRWQYGFAPAAAPDRFQPMTTADTSDPVGLWHPDSRTYYPYVASNSTTLGRVDATNSWAVRARQVAMEAAPDGAVSVVRFIVPDDATYTIEAVFEGIHFRHSTTDVHVRRGGAALFDAEIDGYGGDPAFHAIDGSSPTARFVGTLALRRGEIVSFVVGVGKDAANANDTTGLRARLTRD